MILSFLPTHYASCSNTMHAYVVMQEVVAIVGFTVFILMLAALQWHGGLNSKAERILLVFSYISLALTAVGLAVCAKHLLRLLMLPGTPFPMEWHYLIEESLIVAYMGFVCYGLCYVFIKIIQGVRAISL